MNIILIGANPYFVLIIHRDQPAIWKDPGLLGLAILLLLSGAGRFSIDYLISKKYDKSN